MTSSDEEWLDGVLHKLVKPSRKFDYASGPALHHFNEATRHIQKGLVLSLGSMDFSNYEGMILRANEVFTIMNSLSTDYLFFYDNVKEFIKCSALLARMGSDDSSREELQSQYEEKKVCFDEASELHTKTSAKLSESQERASYLEAEINKLEAELVLRKEEVASLSS